MIEGSKDTILYFFTDEYPYSTGETFIENEIETLSHNFDQIIIITKNTTSTSIRQVPENVSVIRNDFKLSFLDKLLSVFNLFSKIFRDEFFYLRKNAIPLTKTNISYMLSSLTKGKIIAHFLSKMILKHNSSKEVYLYSYWCMDESIGISLYKRKNPSVKAFTRAHRMDLYFYASSNGYLPYKQYILDSLDTFYSISEDGISYLKDELHLQLKDNVTVSYLGTKRYKSLEEIQLSSDTHRIMSCSNIYPNKRVDLIADAIQLTDSPVQWDHFGGYMDFTESNYKAKLESAFESINKTQHTATLKGRFSNTELMNHLKKIDYDLFINLSDSEGIPVSIMEAFSFGIPVIATNVGGVSEIVIDGYNGFLFEKNPKAEDISKKISDFYSLDIEKKNVFRKNAYETWNNNFNSKANYESFAYSIKSIK